MQHIDHSILGSGLSAFVIDQCKVKSTIFTNNEFFVKKSKRFYEFQSIGGNSNLWGGYLNHKRYKDFLKNEKFKKFMQNNNNFEIRKFIKNNKFKNTYFLSNFNENKVFRIKKEFFNGKIIINKIQKITIYKNNILLESNNDIYQSDSVSICLGNLGLIELLYNSDLINNNDQVSFYDGSVSYNLNIFLNHKKNYYIPMTLSEIIKKLFLGKLENRESKIGNTLISQKFSKVSKQYKYTVGEILNSSSYCLRFMLSHHIVKLRINGVPIAHFIEKVSNKISVNCSGALEKYIAGPISQDIIYQAFINSNL